MDHIDSNNYDKKISSLLKNREGKGVLKSQFDMEYIVFAKRVESLLSFISSFEPVSSITYKILFWEKDEILNDFFVSNFQNKPFVMRNGYKGKQKPGIIFLDEKNIDDFFFTTLLNNHFNFEMAMKPSLNMRVQICLNLKTSIVIMDIYDDRGFHFYFLT